MAELVVTVDCRDPDRMAEFWAAALGYQRGEPAGQYRPIRPGGDGVTGPKILFQQVDDPTPGKNRWHLDIDLDAGETLPPEVDRLVALGATAHELVEEFGIAWRVMNDPEGNVFCVVSPG